MAIASERLAPPLLFSHLEYLTSEEVRRPNAGRTKILSAAQRLQAAHQIRRLEQQFSAQDDGALGPSYGDFSAGLAVWNARQSDGHGSSGQGVGYCAKLTGP